MSELEEEKSCHECIHCRVCHFYLLMRENKEMGVFFKGYKISSFANICDNYNKEANEDG